MGRIKSCFKQLVVKTKSYKTTKHCKSVGKLWNRLWRRNDLVHIDKDSSTWPAEGIV